MKNINRIPENFAEGQHRLKYLLLLLVVCIASSCSAMQLADSPGSDTGTNGPAPAASGPYPPFGFSPFPFAATVEAIDRTYEIARDNGGLYVIHRDNGIPWYEALNNLPFPKKVRNDWKDYARRRPRNMPFYLGLSPLGEDRETLVYASEGSKKPKIFNGRDLDDREVIQAYTNYVFKAIEVLDPDYLNLGIEAGELAYRKPREWSKFVTLYSSVARAVKAKYPEISIGISFGLQTFLEKGVAERSQSLIDQSDFIGISFYPYMSQFHERFGTAALPSPPQQWRDPLEKLRAIATKPIAICETGYTSNPVTVPKYRLSMNGSLQLQQEYLQELADFASRDSYLFVVWFMPVDYEQLFETIPKGDGVYLLWQNIGLFDRNLSAKPAWRTWQTIVGKSGPVPYAPHAPKNTAPGDTSTSAGYTIGFNSGLDGISGSPKDKLKTVDVAGDAGIPNTVTQAIDWSYGYKKGRWQYITKEIPAGALANNKSLTVYIRSSRPDSLLLQLSESGGEGFFAAITPTTNWTSITIPFNKLTVANDSRQDGKLVPATIRKLLIADTGGVSDGTTGRRWVQIGQILFE